MTKKQIAERLDQLILDLHSPVERPSIAGKIHLCKSTRKPNELIPESLDYLQLCLHYVLLDVESLRRENKRLRAKLGDK